MTVFQRMYSCTQGTAPSPTCKKGVISVQNISFSKKINKMRSNKVTVIMAPKRKRSKLWNYFEKLNPSLVKCTTCKKEIKVSRPGSYTRVMRMHLSRHGIFLDNDTVTLPDNLRQCYSELPGYKAKCNNCGETISFLTDVGFLRRHLRRHSTIIQGRDEADMVPRKKRSKLWNYFEELKPTLVKCTTCKKEIKISHPSNRTTKFRAHLKRHKIFLDNDTLSLPDDLKQYYSMLPRYKAKCNNCGKAVSFLTTMAHLRKHLRRHSIFPTRIQSRNEPSTSSLADDIMDPSAHRQSQDTSGLLVQSFIKETTEKTDALNEPNTSSSTGRVMDPNAELQSQETIDLSLQSCEQSRKETGACVGSSTSSLADYMDPAKRQSGELSGLTVQSFKETTERTGALNESGTSTGYNTNLIAECQSQETVDLDPQTCEQSRKDKRACDGPSTSSLADNGVDPSADRQSQDTSNLFIQSFKEAIEKTGALDKPSTLSSTAYIMDPSTGKYIPLRQSQEQVPSGLHVQSFKETAENTGVLDEPSTSSSADYVMDPSAEHQSGEPSGFPVQSFEQMTEGTSALYSDWFYYTIPSASSSTCYVMAPSAEHQSGEQPGLPVQSFEQMTEGTSALHSCIGFYYTM
ncbi:uncharacterized protein [Temnothorax nylanderi]|uniref:uncharacterized protein isoform X2 n=1 Tax=Temnothorax nylanderi TaxID=102681 RepID=UPI003A87FA62